MTYIIRDTATSYINIEGFFNYDNIFYSLKITSKVEFVESYTDEYINKWINRNRWKNGLTDRETNVQKLTKT